MSMAKALSQHCSGKRRPHFEARCGCQRPQQSAPPRVRSDHPSARREHVGRGSDGVLDALESQLGGFESWASCLEKLRLSP